jgi:hypothetical protein
MVNSKQVRDALVYHAEGNESRWLDALGPNVTKFSVPAGMASDDTTGDQTRFVVTVTEAGAGGDSTIVNSATAGEALTLVTDNAEYDGLNVQLKGEAFKCDTAKPFYFGIKCAISDATQSDFLVGLCETLTALLNVAASHAIAAANVEGVFFFKADGGTTLTAKTYLDGAQTATANAASAMDTSAHVYEIYWDGTTVYFYVDAVLVTSVAASLPDGDLTPSINFRAGAAAAKTMTVYWMKTIQCN